MRIDGNIIVAIMITFCFTTTIFMVIPIKSANQPYNPWLDYDDNGAIGLTDLVNLANSYGTTGDPAKNVNVANWPIESATGYLTAMLVINATNQNYLNINSSQVSIGGKNITVMGCDLSGGVACFGVATTYQSQINGFAPATGAAIFVDTIGTVVGEFALPMNHKINLYNVNTIRVTVQVSASNFARYDNLVDYCGTAIATLYWSEQ